MRIKKVSLDGDLDPFGGRALIVKTDKTTFRTPQRVLTSPEIQYKAKLPSEPPINNELSEIVSQFTKNQWDDFLKKNGVFASRLSKIHFFEDKMGYTTRKFFPQIPSEIKVDVNSIKHLLELQRMSSLDFISMPPLPPEEKGFPKLVEAFSNEVLSEKREPLIYLDMGLEARIFEARFNEMLKLVETGLIHTLGLIYRPIEKFSVNYHLLWKNREAEVLLQMSNVPRRYRDIAPTMHLLQKWGIDTFSVQVGRFYGSNKMRRKEDIIQSIPRLDQEPLMFRSFSDWPQGDHPIGCGCPICKDLTTEEFVENYWGENESYEGEVFNAANRLHEYYKSCDEFLASRELVLEGALKDYFKNKEGLVRSDLSIPATLNGWG
jgi:hypothetical protein